MDGLMDKDETKWKAIWKVKILHVKYLVSHSILEMHK